MAHLDKSLDCHDLDQLVVDCRWLYPKFNQVSLVSSYKAPVLASFFFPNILGTRCLDRRLEDTILQPWKCHKTHSRELCAHFCNTRVTRTLHQIIKRFLCFWTLQSSDVSLPVVSPSGKGRDFGRDTTYPASGEVTWRPVAGYKRLSLLCVDLAEGCNEENYQLYWICLV